MTEIINFIDAMKNFFIISSGFIALRSYLSQQRQRKIDNSKKLLEEFHNVVHKNDLDQWEQIFLNSYESIRANPGNFIVFDKNNNPTQVAHANLFISEGKGFYFYNGKMNLEDDVSNINFGSIRRITEQLNIISYEVLYGHVELTILYYELGQIISSIYYWLNNTEDEYSQNNNYSLYPYFLRMYRKNQRKLEKLNYKIYQGLC